MTIDEMVERGKVAVEECGPDFWTMLAHNKTHDYESCYLCGSDIASYATDVDLHEDWCPTVIARRVLNLPTNREPE